MAEGDTLISVDYEIFGKVQGVFFRKYTQVCGLQAFGTCMETRDMSRPSALGGEAGCLVAAWQRRFAEQWVWKCFATGKKQCKWKAHLLFKIFFLLTVVLEDLDPYSWASLLHRALEVFPSSPRCGIITPITILVGKLKLTKEMAFRWTHDVYVMYVIASVAAAFSSDLFHVPHPPLHSFLLILAMKELSFPAEALLMKILNPFQYK